MVKAVGTHKVDTLGLRLKRVDIVGCLPSHDICFVSLSETNGAELIAPRKVIMIEDCINRPLITAEVVSQALGNRVNELIDGSIHWLGGHDDNRAVAAETLGDNAFWIIINEMLDEQSKVYQDRVISQSIDRGYPSYEM